MIYDYSWRSQTRAAFGLTLQKNYRTRSYCASRSNYTVFQFPIYNLLFYIIVDYITILLRITHTRITCEGVYHAVCYCKLQENK